MKNKTIAGQSISLEAGVCYIASIPGNNNHIVNIRVNSNSPDALDAEPVLTFNLSKEAARELLNEFNNDPRGSLYGRVW